MMLKQLEWSTRSIEASYDLRSMGVFRPSGVEVVQGSLYVLDGDPPNPIWRLKAQSGLESPAPG